ncbi:uncharacterized protein DFL_005891 [Arthrobotrys flagrans]|uniref:Uncharacterized protein n=1 Tax=Arthrobotrys flagrans TaxID=97331 RepID=A0A436ZZD8_ARTFL|nr:hypothetical protein DFL_005891 [Arthrobotrys flagrans]
MELRLIIPTSPAPGRYEIETSYPTSTLPSPRYRSKEIVSSISNPEYRTTPYDRLEITIKERTKSSQKHGERRSPSGNLIASKSTPNLRRTLETVPRPPPPLPIRSARSERRSQRPFPYANSDASKVSSASNSPWSNPSSSISDISPLTPDNGQLFFLPSFQERNAGLAIEFQPMETQSQAEFFGPHTRLSNHTMVYELEDTSRRRLDSPVGQLSPVSLLEKPLPLLPCPKSVERKIYRSESSAPFSKSRRHNPSSNQPELRSTSLRSERKPSMVGHGASQTYLHNSPAQSAHTTVSWGKDYRPNTGHSRISFRQLQPDSQNFHQQHQIEQNQGQRKKKQQKAAFSIHLGRLHLVFGSTKQELADSRRNAGMYSDFETPNRSYCQDSRGRIQHV